MADSIFCSSNENENAEMRKYFSSLPKFVQENIRQWKVIRELQTHVAMEKMVNHEFLNDDRSLQRSTFSDGTRVTVDFTENTYEIVYPQAQ